MTYVKTKFCESEKRGIAEWYNDKWSEPIGERYGPISAGKRVITERLENHITFNFPWTFNYADIKRTFQVLFSTHNDLLL